MELFLSPAIPSISGETDISALFFIEILAKKRFFCPYNVIKTKYQSYYFLNLPLETRRRIWD